MEKKASAKQYVKINVEQSKIHPGLSSITINTNDPKDFMIATLLGIKALSEKSGIEYEDLLDLVGDLLRHETVMNHSLERIRKEEEDTLI